MIKELKRPMKFELEEYRRNIPEKELIEDLKRVALILKNNLVTIDKYNKHGKFHDSTLRRKFGSWFKALEKAGLEKTRNFNLSEKELIDDLIKVARLLKKNSLTCVEYREYGNFSATTFIRKFDSWSKALEKAGLKKTKNYSIPTEEYFKNLEEVWVKLGRQPHYRDMQKPLSKYSAGAYEDRFGTWRKALKKFIEYINNEEKPIVNEEIAIIDKPDLPQEVIYKHKTKRNISWRLRFIVMKRDSFKCRICGRSPAKDPKIVLHVDHIIPYSKDGETILGNLQTLCSKCNIGKSNL